VSLRKQVGEINRLAGSGVALQKNYISVYFAINKDIAPIARPYAGKLGELRMGRNNFSFENSATSISRRCLHGSPKRQASSNSTPRTRSGRCRA
jgi:hypothetical protein